MFAFLRDQVPTAWHTYFFPVFRAVKDAYERIDRVIDKRAFSESGFVNFLRDLGFVPGATIMVHSSFSHIRRRVPNMSPEDLVRLLQDLVGRDGTLLMPTFPFIGSQGQYADSNTHFDVQKTPSKVG